MAKWHHVAAALGLAASLPWYAIAQENTGAPQPAEQDERVVLEADYVYEVRDENKLVAEGNVEALYQGRILRADKIVYDRTTEKVRASGNVIIIDETGSQFQPGRRLCNRLFSAAGSGRNGRRQFCDPAVKWRERAGPGGVYRLPGLRRGQDTHLVRPRPPGCP